MAAPDSIQHLVKRFEEHRDSYRSGKYNETQLRREFLDPFLKALGWDIDNEQGYAEAYKDVIHEDSLDMEGATKAPDYAFRIGGTRKFFVEAKKPAVNIQYDIFPAFQLRRYAWSAKLPLSILTDFEEFAVYESRSKPDKSDSAATGRVMLLNYKDYLTKWDQLAAIFSREAVLKGSFDQYTEGLKGKRGTTEVDDAFLQEIEHWRDLLARIIALRNPDLQVRELNYAVQMTIDRIVFLRICEDRGIERENQLQELLEGEGVYQRLCQVFRQADNRYNSGLFHFSEEKGQSSRPDDLTLSLAIDDKVLKEIISGLYYPAPYVFREIPADILGQVYERFLGKVIRLTSGHQAKVEEKPEVRKGGGVYYTPTYIVDYIVRNTVGKLLEGRTPRDVASLKILDPACGSGSFLLGAYQYLLDWHTEWYSKHEPETWAKGKTPAIYQAQGGGYRLTTAEKKRILLGNIHGVDIDPQAVEVTKLSLSLKVLEGESQETIVVQLGLFKERALPDLGRNIQCGNSLIGPDYFEGRMFPDEEERYRVNAFNWQAAFPQVFISGGFDAVIGNPPYGQVVDDVSKQYFGDKFKTTEGRFDTFELFIEKGINLCKLGKVLGYIVPNPLFSNLYSRKLRKFLLDQCSIDEITNFGMNVFADPTIHTCIVILKHGKDKNLIRVRKQVTEIIQLNAPYDYEILQSNFGVNTNFTFDIFIDPMLNTLISKLSQQSRPLGDFCYIRQCIKTGNDDVYVKIFDGIPDEPWKPTLRGRSISRYGVLEKREYLQYGSWLARNWQNRTFYETPKIAIRETGKRIIATLDTESRYFLSSLYAIYPKSPNEDLSLDYLLGILNSNLATYIAKAIALDLTEGAFTKFRTNQLARLPIRILNFSDPSEKAAHDKMVALVERMLALHLRSARTPQEKEMIRREIESTDGAIDSLVYDLYGLTEAEIKIVEGK
jgi:type I restriction-modification system DNA methylase subunit